MTEALGATLVFDPPVWGSLLGTVVALALVWETISLARWLASGRSAAAAVALTALSVLLGPAVAIAAGVHGALAGVDKARRTLLYAALWGTFIQVAAVLTYLSGRADWAFFAKTSRGGPVLALMLLAIVWAWRAYGRTTTPLRRGVKGLLLGLRIVLLVLLAVWLLRPALEHVRTEHLRRWVLVAVDASGSMARKDMPPVYTDTVPAQGQEPVSRMAAVRDALNDKRQMLLELARDADVEVFTFADLPIVRARLSPDDPSRPYPPLEPVGEATAIGDSLARACDAHAANNEDVAAIVLLSDGCNNTAERLEPKRFAKIKGASDVPIYTVGVGSETPGASTRTLTTRDLRAPDEIETFNKLPIVATVEAIGLAGREIEITCTFADKPVGEPKRVRLTKLRQIIPVELVHVPLTTGYHRLRVHAQCVGARPAGLAGEPSASKLVHVVDRNMRILYVEGKFRFESKYIARALVAARRFRLDRRVLLAPLRADAPPPLGEQLDDWLSYHAIIFGDVKAEQFTPAQLEIVRRLVDEYGKGFCMIGGYDSFGPGGWADTPIAKLMPVDLARSFGQVAGPIEVVPTDEGLRDPIMRIDDDVAAAWAKLPTLPECSRLVGPKPGATVLARSRNGEVLIAAQQYGKGRALAIAFDTTWHWVLSPKDTAEHQKRFWRQVVLYLVAPRGSAWIVTNKTSYEYRRHAQPETVRVEAGVEDASGRPLTQVPVSVELVSPSGVKTPVRLAADEARKMFRGALPLPSEAGVHTLTISATVEGKELTSEHKFEVLRRDLEALEVLARFDLLRRMAVESGGEFAPLARFGDVLERVRVASQPQMVERLVRDDLSAKLSWPIILALIALLCAEWAVRKRKGLV